MNSLAQISTTQQTLQPELLLVTEATQDAIDIRDPRFAWKNREAPVLDIHRLKVGRGERLFIVGPSGSGSGGT